MTPYGTQRNEPRTSGFRGCREDPALLARPTDVQHQDHRRPMATELIRSTKGNDARAMTSQTPPPASVSAWGSASVTHWTTVVVGATVLDQQY